MSYDVNKDGVKVAVLTFTKSAYRLGETVLGVVELNGRKSRARVLSVGTLLRAMVKFTNFLYWQLSAILEAHESLPASVSPPPSRQMRRVHAEHHSSFVLSSLRTNFSLDIPSDASPAFQLKIGEGSPSGGLEWRVRLCLLVVVASESSITGPDGVCMKHLIRDGPRGEWGSSWKAPNSIAPMERPKSNTSEEQVQTWGQFLVTSLLGANGTDEDAQEGGNMWDGDGEGEDQRDYGGGDEGWKHIKVETVECEVPIKVWPGNTAFKAMDVVFDV